MEYEKLGGHEIAANWIEQKSMVSEPIQKYLYIWISATKRSKLVLIGHLLFESSSTDQFARLRIGWPCKSH